MYLTNRTELKCYISIKHDEHLKTREKSYYEECKNSSSTHSTTVNERKRCTATSDNYN